jgi:hypothetical protein
MKKIANYSSWMAHSLWGRYLVDGRKDWIISMLPSLEWEYNHWETTHTREGGLYWQADVQDAMEETISGGRKKKYLRPSINAYMYGNAYAIGKIFALADSIAKSRTYFAKAEDLSEKAEHFDRTLDVRGKRAEEALDIVDKYLDEAKLLSIKEVSILHGKGNGILSKLIREKLGHIHEVERFCDASLETGGTGITRVYFR